MIVTSFYKTSSKNQRKASDVKIADEVTDNAQESHKYYEYMTHSTKSNESIDSVDSIEPDDGNKFIVIPIIDPKEMNAISFFISGGTAGSGKSYFARDVVNQLLKLDRFNFKINDTSKKTQQAKIYLITGQVAPDPVYENGFKTYLKFDLRNRDFYQLNEAYFKNCIVIFDDITAMENTPEGKFIADLQKKLLQNNRKLNCGHRGFARSLMASSSFGKQ